MTDELETVTDLDIQALVDNCLEPEQSRRVIRYVKEHPVAAKRYQALLEQKKLLISWWRWEKQKRGGFKH